MSELQSTGKAVVEFLTNVAARGDMNANTAGAMKAAVKEVLGSVHPDDWETVDVSKIDLDKYADRFARLRATKFKAASLKVYQARFKNAVSMFMEWRKNPAEWKYTAERPYKERRSKQQREQQQGGQQQENNGSAVGTSYAPAVVKASGGVQMIEYPYPLRRDLLVTLRLPTDLTKQEASRLQAYIESLAFEERPALPAASGDAS